MKRSDAQTIGGIITQALKAEHLDCKFDEQNLLSLWPEVVGAGINRYTISRSIHEGILYLRISSAPLRNELMLNRSTLIRQLNDAVGREVIHDIIFK